MPGSSLANLAPFATFLLAAISNPSPCFKNNMHMAIIAMAILNVKFRI